MTARERRIAELAAQDLESWARELPLGSETRRELQRTARAYRFGARAGAVPLQAVPDSGAEEQAAGLRAAREPGSELAPARSALAEAPRALHRPLQGGA